MKEESAKTSSHAYRLLVFWLGIIATLAYRSIIVIAHYSSLWVDIAWYIGTIGFLWYFAHRFNIESKRDRLIEEKKLIDKISKGQTLSEEERSAVVYVLKSLVSSKSKWNYIAIFIASGLALLYDIVLRLIVN